jgi:hypothetical protein
MRFLNRAWLVLFVALSAAPVLKFGDVQAMEATQTLWLFLAAPLFLYRGLRVPCSGIWRRYGAWYLLFLGFCLGVSLLALRLPFYAPPDISVLKQPGLLSLSRIFELSLAICFMLLVARALAGRRALLRLALDVYVWVGLASALASIAGWVLMKTAGISTFVVYGYEDRVRGFFNEGGPYGIYLVSVAVVLWARASALRAGLPAGPAPGGSPARRLGSLPLKLLPLAAALLLSGSKAGLLAALCLGLLGVAAAGSRRSKIAILSASAVVLIAFLTLFQGKLYGYFWSYLNFEEALAYRPGDPSLVMGRIAASIVVPRMIAAHPVLGIGPGNYSLMRNDPEYLQGLPAVDDWDLSGMGLFGSAAEFGLPLTLFLLWLLLRPLSMARRRKAPVLVAVAAGFPALAFLLGVNLNFFYPWLVGAFVISTESSQC